MKRRVLSTLISFIAGILILGIVGTMSFAIVYIPVPSYTLVSPTIPGFYVVGGSGTSSYYMIGFATTSGGGTTNVTGTEPLPTLNPNFDESSAPTNPLSPLVQVWADMWTVPVNMGWIVGSMFIAICTFIFIAYKFQHIGFAMCAACIVLGFFSYPAVHILPVAVFIMSIVGLIAGVVIESRA